MRASRRSEPTDAYRDGMLTVAERLLGEFAHLPFLLVAETMNAVRRQAASGPHGPEPDTVYRLARSLLVDAGSN